MFRLVVSINKARKFPIGTVRKQGGVPKRKVSEGKWVPVKNIKSKKPTLESKIDSLIKWERKQGHTYPIAQAYKNYYTDLKKVKGKKAIINLTTELDSFLKRGDKFSIKENKAADYIRNQLTKLLVAKRREVIKPYNAKPLKQLIKKYKDNINEVYEGKVPKETKEVFDVAESMVSTLEHPETIGLYEESEYPTVKAELNSKIKLIGRMAKRGAVYPFDDADNIKKLKFIVNKILSSRST